MQVSQAGPYAAKSEKSGDGTASYFTEVPLARFPPGRYWMQVNVMDTADNQVAFARIPMAILAAPEPQKGGGSDSNAAHGTGGN